LQTFDAAAQEILAEYLRHAKAVQQERERAANAKEVPNFIKLLHEWGGVSIVYRRTMQESPAYINNHEELQKALNEGVFYLECLEPMAVDLNEFGYAESLICHKRLRDDSGDWIATVEEVRLPARAILVATGTQPNTAYEFEHRGTFNRLNLKYQHYEDKAGELIIAHGVEHCKDKEFGAFTSYQQNDHRVSLIGDTHPVFHGNVVKAIASGLRTYPKILALFSAQLSRQGEQQEYNKFAANMQALFTSKIHSSKLLDADMLELCISAPLAAKRYHPGHFYRLQNFETKASLSSNTLLQMEPLAITAADCDPQTGRVSFFI
jgi:hypothetical protein